MCYNHGNKLLDKRPNLRESIISYNRSQKLLRQIRKTVLFRLATSNVKPFLETIWSG